MKKAMILIILTCFALLTLADEVGNNPSSLEEKVANLEARIVNLESLNVVLVVSSCQNLARIETLYGLEPTSLQDCIDLLITTAQSLTTTQSQAHPEQR